MKNMKYIILFCLILISCGCSYKYASTTRNIRHAGFNIASSEFKCNSIYEKEDVKDKIRFYIGNYMITESGNIYETSLGKVFSNDLNCRKPSFDKKFNAIFDLSIIKGDDKKYYSVGGNEESAAFSEVTSNNQDYQLYDILLKDDDVIKAATVNSKEGTYYVLKNDGCIYRYDILKNNNTYTLNNSFLMYDGSLYGGDIVDFNYNGSSTTTYVKTKNNYYRMKVTNKDECYKYVDVACKYELDLDENLTKDYDRILAYNGSTLITNYGKVFNVNN